MSWHFSQALVEEYSRATCSDGELFAPLRSTTMLGAYCWRDKTTESLDLFQFGMTFERSTASLGEDVLTWYRGGFLARTLASPARCGGAAESTGTAAGCGPSIFGSSEKSSRDTSSAKTRPSCEGKGCPESFETWPASGMYADGSLSELTTAVCRTSASGYGFSLPTPTARDWKDTPGMALERRDGKTRTDRLPMLLFSAVRSAGIKWQQTTPSAAQTVKVRGLNVTIQGREYSPELPEWLMGWPIGWTGSEPLEMDRFLSWRQQHGNY